MFVAPRGDCPNFQKSDRVLKLLTSSVRGRPGEGLLKKSIGDSHLCQLRAAKQLDCPTAKEPVPFQQIRYAPHNIDVAACIAYRSTIQSGQLLSRSKIL